MTIFAYDLKSSNCHSLILWQCLVVYSLEFKTIFQTYFLNLFFKTIDILNKFTIPSLVCKKIGDFKKQKLCIIVVNT